MNLEKRFITVGLLVVGVLLLIVGIRELVRSDFSVSGIIETVAGVALLVAGAFRSRGSRRRRN
jgi:uncharacterized membrane protein HdeD (DUF308 family)